MGTVIDEIMDRPQSEFVFSEPSFFFVWTKTGRVPRRTHGSYDSAMKEAMRLAAKHPGKKFIVLQATDKVSAVVREEA